MRWYRCRPPSCSLRRRNEAAVASPRPYGVMSHHRSRRRSPASICAARPRSPSRSGPSGQDPKTLIGKDSQFSGGDCAGFDVLASASAVRQYHPDAVRERAAETDCVAGVVGFELRCAQRKFISLRCRVSSDSGAPAETAAVPTENDLLRWGWTVFLTAVAVSPTLRTAH
jgi:hypothetical protein